MCILYDPGNNNIQGTRQGYDNLFTTLHLKQLINGKRVCI